MRLRTALVLIGLVGATPAVGQSWFPVESGTTVDLHDIFDATNFDLIVGSDGTLLRSTDAGLSWSDFPTGTTEDFISVEVHSQTLWWLAGANGTVRVSTNSGGVWVDRSPSTDQTLYTFSRSGAHSYAVGDAGAIFKTTNRGVDWSTQESGTTAGLHSGNGFTSGPAHAVGDDGTILGSSNGVDWVAIESGVSADLYGYMEGSGLLFAVGSGGTILKSTDSGMTWSTKTSGTTENLFAIAQAGVNRYVVVGAGGIALKSTDAGESWCFQDTGVDVDLYAVLALNSLSYYAVGQNGTIVRTEDGGGPCLNPSSVGETGEMGAAELRIAPHPVRDQATLDLRGIDLGPVRLRVLDANGRLVRDVPQSLAVASDEVRMVQLDTHTLSSGVYWVRVDGETGSLRARMIVLR